MGPVSYKMSEEDPFLGREIHQQRQFSEHTMQIIDEEVARILHDAADRASKILRDNKDKLDKDGPIKLQRERVSGGEDEEKSRSEKAADILIEHGDAIQEAVFFSVANLLNLKVDLLFFDGEDSGESRSRRLPSCPRRPRSRTRSLPAWWDGSARRRSCR